MMKAWIVRNVPGLGGGLGGKDVLLIPLENGNTLRVDTNTDNESAWIEEELNNQPSPGRFDEVEIPDDLGQKIISFHKDRKGLDHDMEIGVIKFVADLGRKTM